MSRTKSTGLIKVATRPRSDAGSAGFRPLRDLPRTDATSKPIDPGSPVEAAKMARALEDFGAVADAPSKPESPRRRMVQEDLFAGLGVKL